jgi:hypothetical protein
MNMAGLEKKAESRALSVSKQVGVGSLKPALRCAEVGSALVPPSLKKVRWEGYWSFHKAILFPWSTVRLDEFAPQPLRF